MRRVAWLLVAVAGTSGCGLVLDLVPRQPDGPRWDAGQPDTGPVVGPDAGPGLSDAGPGLDASRPPDATPVLDAGGVDSGPGTSPVQCFSRSECPRTDDCFYYPWGPGTCTPTCALDSECGDPRSVCHTFGIGACSPICNPITNEGCPDGLGCAFFEGETAGAPIDFTWCIGAGTHGQGDTCAPTGGFDPTLCARDFWCDGFTCQQKCRIGASDCPTGYSCYGFTDGVIISSVEYGLCY